MTEKQYQPKNDLERELMKDIMRSTSIRPITAKMLAERMGGEDVKVTVTRKAYGGNRYVRLGEEDTHFFAEGDSRIVIAKPKGDILGVLCQTGINAGIEYEAVYGFSLDEQRVPPPELYLNWRKDNLRMSSLVGRVGDIEQAKHWMDQVNSLYRR